MNYVIKKRDQTLFSSTRNEMHGCVLIDLEESNGSDEGEDASGGDATGSSGNNGGLGALRDGVGTGRVDGDGAGGGRRSGVLRLDRLSGVAGSGSGRVRSGDNGLAGLTGVLGLARLAGGRHGVRVLGLRLGDSARAVGDGEGGGLSDGVGLVAVGESGRLRAVGGDGGEDLGGVDNGREDRLCGLDGVGDCERAVGDGQGGGLSDSVGLVTVGESGRTGAVGCGGSDNLCCVVSTVAVDSVGRGLGSSDEEASGGSSLEERHFD